MVLEFRCGKCKLGSNGTTVTADPRKVRKKGGDLLGLRW